MQNTALKTAGPIAVRSVSSLKLVVGQNTDARRRDIARQAEEVSTEIDFEAFLAQYGAISDFA